MALVHVKEDNFEKEIEKSDLPVIVDFYADWCGPCKMMAPVFEEMSKKYDGKVKFAEIDVDAEQSLALKFGVMSIPTLIIFKNGQEVDKLMGLQDEDSLTEKLNSL